MTDQDLRTRDPRTPPDRTLERPDTDWAEPASSTQDSTAPDSADAEREDGAVYRSAAHESLVEPVVDEPGAEKPTAEHAAGDGFDAVDGSEPAGHADPERAYPEHGDPEQAVGVASVPDAEPEAAEEHDDIAAVTDTGQPVDDVDEGADVTGGVDDAVAPDVTGSGELLPGDVLEGPVLALFDGGTTERFRERWQQLQLRFIDDPHTVAGQAGALADEVVTALRDAVDRQRTALEDWQSGDGVDTHSGDTERLRVAVRRYRDFLDRLLGL